MEELCTLERGTVHTSKTNAHHALFWGLKNILPDSHQDGRKRILYFRARLTSEMQALQGYNCTFVQGDRSEALSLLRAGYAVEPQIEVDSEEAATWPLILYLPTKFREEVEEDFQLLLRRLTPDGLLVVAMDNSLGAKRFEKTLAKITGSVESVSKMKCRVFWCQGVDCHSAWSRATKEFHLPGGGKLISCSGLFSHGELDRGTEFLLETLPHNLSGEGADFGCGYGAISHYLLSHCPKVKSIALVDAEWKALQMSRINLAPWEDRVTYHWIDLTREQLALGFDWIVMNPPFHRGEAADVAIGKAFIAHAAHHLHRRGELYLVANRTLPYENELAQCFEQYHVLRERHGFKVLMAANPRKTSI